MRSFIQKHTNAPVKFVKFQEQEIWVQNLILSPFLSHKINFNYLFRCLLLITSVSRILFSQNISTVLLAYFFVLSLTSNPQLLDGIK